MLKREKFKAFPLKIRTKTRVSFSPLSFNIMLELIVRTVRYIKEIKET